MLALHFSSPIPTVTRLASSINFARRWSNQGLRFHTSREPLAHSTPGTLTVYSQAAGTSFLPALRSSPLQCRSSNNSVTGNSDIFLIIYSKPGCHLCDGLKEKVQAVLAKAMFQPSPLSHANLQIRNILDEPEWEAAYGMVIPVLTAIKSGEKEEIKIPRAPPRISAERLSDHIVKSLKL